MLYDCNKFIYRDFSNTNLFRYITWQKTQLLITNIIDSDGFRVFS